jgi:hypothetical protein
VGNVVPNRSVVVDIEIPRENSTHGSPLASIDKVDLQIPRGNSNHGSPLASSVKRCVTTPVTYNRQGVDDYEDEGEKWIEVIRKSRAKHPKKRVQC